MQCWKCGASIEDKDGKISFRCECISCGAWQHACYNCQFYKVGAAHACTIPNIASIRDKENRNFCEEFKALGAHQKTADPRDAAKRLFGDDDSGESPPASGFSRFDNLFGD